MANFRYLAIDAAGQAVDGQLEADDVKQAVAELEARGLSVQSIGMESPEILLQPEETTGATQPPGRSAERAALESYMGTVLERGRAIAPALLAYAEEMPAGRQRSQLLTLCRVLQRGDESDAMAALSELPESWLPLLSAATSSTELDEVLGKYLADSRRMEEVRQHWWLTLAYPLLLACIALAILVGLSIFVIPEFSTLFDDFELELPALTVLIVKMGRWLSSWGGLLFAALLFAFIVLVLNANRLLPLPALAWLSSRIRLPYRRRTAVARFSRSLADLLEAGLDMPDALRVAGYTARRSRLQQAAWNLANDLDASERRFDRAYRRPLTAAVWYALAVKMPTAARVRLLRDISVCHAERVRYRLSWSHGIIEPIAILFVGFVVGWIVLGLFIPLVKLIEGLSG